MSGIFSFEEAYQRSKRVLNITVATAGHGGTPTLLNYLTAPQCGTLNIPPAAGQHRLRMKLHKEARLANLF